MRNFARSQTLELKDRHLRVNTLSPGPTVTPTLENTTGLTPKQAEQAAVAEVSQIPIGRRGEPEELAGAAVFLVIDGGGGGAGVT